jgi:hypothetical protein
MSENDLTFDLLVRLEPRLLTLVQEAALVKDDADNFCANEVWSEQFKPRLMQLVGWYAEGTHPHLNSHAAYEIAYDIIYQTLPDCKHCGCKEWIVALFPGGECQ